MEWKNIDFKRSHAVIQRELSKMLDSALEGLLYVLEPRFLCVMIAGIIISLIFGVIPAISDLTLLVLALPIIFGMDPMFSLPLILANEHRFLNLAHAQQNIEAWTQTYNTERPHRFLNNLPPYEFIKEHIIPLQDERLNLKLAQRMG